MIRRSLAALLALAFVGGTVQAQGKKVYDWTFVPGRTITWTTKQVNSIETKLDGKQTGDIRYEITSKDYRKTHSVDGDAAKLELTPTEMRVDVRYGKTKALWDSTKRKLRKARGLPYIKPWSEQFDRKALFTMSIAERKVTDLRYEKANKARKLIKPWDGGEQEKQNIESGRKLFPTTPVGPGDEWDWSSPMPLDHEHLLSMEGKLKFVGFDTVDGKKCAKLEGKRQGTLQMVVKGQKPKLEVLKAVERTTIWFDVEHGFIRKSTNESTTSISKVLNIKDEGQKTEVETIVARTTMTTDSVEGGE